MVYNEFMGIFKFRFFVTLLFDEAFYKNDYHPKKCMLDTGCGSLLLSNVSAAAAAAAAAWLCGSSPSSTDE